MELLEIEEKKKIFGTSNCFDFERSFFEIDHYRKGYIELEEVTFDRLYESIVENIH